MRFNCVLARSKRLVSLKGGGRTMARGAALLHGCACLGMPDQWLRQLRREARRALRGGRGAKGIALQLAVTQEEPPFEMTEAPLEMGKGGVAC
eukprot:6097920-Pyramimonas_sp.AAC.1